MRNVLLFLLFFESIIAISQTTAPMFNDTAVYAPGVNEEKMILSKNIKYRDAVSFEFFGTGVLYTLNYHHVFGYNGGFKWVLNAGGSVYPITTANLTFNVLPAMLLGSGKKHLELGAGLTAYYLPYLGVSFGLFSPKEIYSAPYFTTLIGYRFQKPNKRFLFRFVFYSYFLPGNGITSTLGFTLGRSF